jgi:hypothetical protein
VRLMVDAYQHRRRRELRLHHRRDAARAPGAAP